MKRTLKIVSVLAVIAIIYFGYKDLSNRKPTVESTKDSVAIPVDTAKVDSVKVVSIPTVK